MAGPTFAVIGGSEAGDYHARQLRRALASGALTGEVVVVDEGWGEFLAGWLPRARPADHLVPAPLMPHLLWEWLAASARAVPVAAPGGWRLPYEAPGPGGVRFLSAAAWTCPATCVEPEHCPALHAPRDWDLSQLIEKRAIELGWKPAVFRCLHLTHGVGTIPVASILEARQRAAELPSGARILVATSSRCHAAVGGLAVRSSG